MSVHVSCAVVLAFVRAFALIICEVSRIYILLIIQQTMLRPANHFASLLFLLTWDKLIPKGIAD